jgi:hypothetical protein
MSDTATAATPPVSPERPPESPSSPSALPPVTLAAKVMEWSRPVIAVFSMSIFALAFFIAWQKSDASTLNILVGAIVSLVSSISGYYFGSSAGSQKKDDVIHAALATAQAQGNTGG